MPDEFPRLRTILLIALVVALLAGAGAWLGGLIGGDVEVPRFANATTYLSTDAAPAAGPRAGVDSAAPALETLRVAPLDTRARYDRDAQFGGSWRDLEPRNGCDARQDTVARQAVTVLERDRRGCVTRAVVADPYTRAQLDRVQVDHVVSLANVWRTGGQNLTQAQRLEVANSPSNLIATTPRENQTLKRDEAADEYLPPDPDYRCDYVARQIGVKFHYGLWVTASERDAMRRVLATCPTVSLPADLQRGRIAR